MRLLPTLTIASALLCASTGCGVLNLLPGRTIHQKCGWKAEDYFDNPQVIALCRAIEANDLAEMERLVKAGADVNAQGKGKMTPLLWALPDNRLPRFRWLLEHGADPNVVIESDFNLGNYMRRGDSVTLMACKTSFPGYFDAVFDHGGDPGRLHHKLSPDKDLQEVIVVPACHQSLVLDPNLRGFLILEQGQRRLA